MPCPQILLNKFLVKKILFKKIIVQTFLRMIYENRNNNKVTVKNAWPINMHLYINNLFITNAFFEKERILIMYELLFHIK